MPPKPKQTNNSYNTNNEMINFYSHKDIQKHLPQYHNPHYEQTQISIPARIGVIASSGGGKTQWLLNFIAKTNNSIFILSIKPLNLCMNFQAINSKGKTLHFTLNLLTSHYPMDFPTKTNDSW